MVIPLVSTPEGVILTDDLVRIIGMKEPYEEGLVYSSVRETESLKSPTV